ncbi:hypothetical protein [Xanthomonas sp. 3075]|uniref:hypothetical protein n=1 Tax=Xanthomonas sp. 3075 TaxID=3035315 RepID=UPI00161CE61D|nr:hypothetical protein [Xanthomonas sp. 3075]MBB4130373.1 hypothetical protein [Xanthomonas sp. 3075]
MQQTHKHLARDTGNGPRESQARYTLPAVLLVGAKWIYLVIGVLAMVVLSPKVLYADPWRYAKNLLSQPWPWNVLTVDNGHREVLPNLLRLAELRWFDGNQWLQISAGVALALLTVWMLHRLVRAERLSVSAQAAAGLVCTMGIFWLGSERALAHANESVHVYLITMFLVAGCWLLGHGSSVWRAVLATLCGFAATFCFGAGIATFVALLAMLLLRRASWAWWCIVLSGFAVSLLLVIGFGDTHIHGARIIAPIAQLDLVLRWLSAPFIYACLPLVDVHVAAQLPVESLRTVAVAISGAYTSVFGPVMVSAWPHRLIGFLGVGCLMGITYACWRRRAESVTERVAISIAWFALAVGGVIALARLVYFQSFPEQLFAGRYQPWPVLFWSGLLLWVFVRHGRLRPRRVAVAGMALACCLLPSTVWMALLAQRMQTAANMTATAAAAGVIDVDAVHGETVLAEVADALPVLKAAQTSIFTWPETRYLEGARMAADPVAIANVAATPVRNLLHDGSAMRFDFNAQTPASRMVLMCDNAPVGVATRLGWGAQWVGWSPRTVAPSCLRAFRVSGSARF